VTSSAHTKSWLKSAPGDWAKCTAHTTPRTGRDVAIKLSAERFNERFDREVRAVAALSHPNICTLFDAGPNYLVIELVEGESPQGLLPRETAIHYARQIASALEVAHDKGIVHLDLKPGNIKITPEGIVKVLDFGLAKVIPTAASGAPSENSPTISMAATQAGMILGTATWPPSRPEVSTSISAPISGPLA